MEILIVEDNPADYALIKAYIQKSNLTTEYFEFLTRNEEAVDFLKSNSSDIILYDLSLPDAYGKEGFKKLYQHTDIPIIVLTGNDDMGLAVDLVASGAQEYLIKNDLTPNLIERSIIYAIERNKLQNELEYNKNKNEAILQTAASPIVIINQSGKINELNRATEQLFDYDKNYLIGEHISLLFNEYSREEINTFIEKNNEMVINDFETKGFTRDGRELILELNISELIIKNNCFYTIIMSNITETKIMEEQLRQSEQKFRSFYENNPLAIVILNSIGEIVEANPKFMELLDYIPEELTGESIFSITHPDDVKKSKLFFKSLLEDPEQSYSFEKRYLSKDEEIRWVNITVFTITLLENGNRLFVDIIKDISDYKEQQRELKQRKEELTKTKKMEAYGLLAGGIAHDFNNILTEISGYAQLTMSRKENPRLVDQYLSKMKNAVDKGVNLTESLLIFADDGLSNKSVIDLNSLLSEMELILKKVGSHISIELKLYNGKLPVYANSGNLEDIILNIVINARDAISKTGSISIRTDIKAKDQLNRIVPLIKENYIELAIEDTGIGMSSEIKEQIFDPFFTTKEKEKGTGLGLTNVKRIVEEHDGFIKIETEEDVGTTFFVYLPLFTGSSLEEYTKSINDTSEIPEMLVGTKILLVEDNDDVRNVIREQLEGIGALVNEAENGEKALDILLEDEAIDLMVTDIQMPVMNGKDLIKFTRQHNSDLPIIAISGDTKEIDLDMDEIHTLLSKPFLIWELAREINQALMD